MLMKNTYIFPLVKGRVGENELNVWSFVSYERPILDDEAKPQKYV